MSLGDLATLPPVRAAAHATVSSPASPAVQSVSSGVGSTVTDLSKASQLMSRLGQLAQQDPSKFKAVAKSIASHLTADPSVQRRELEKRNALQSELAQVDRRLSEERAPPTPGAASTASASPGSSSGSTASARDALGAAFSAASTSGTLGDSSGSAAVSWTDSGLAGALAAALSAVNQALGIAD